MKKREETLETLWEIVKTNNIWIRGIPEEENGMVVGDWVEKKGRQQAKRNLLCQAPM